LRSCGIDRPRREARPGGLAQPVNAYLDEATRAATGIGGHVLERLSDGLMALFGYPHAQENDAETVT
jgi:hypothetical protein